MATDSAPLVSIVVPAYNAGAYLEECLASIGRQTLSDLEVLVVDDGSADETMAVAQGFADRDSRFRVFSTPNRGVSAARNLGIDNARGRYLSFVDSDDILHPRALEAMLNALERYEADVCITAFRKFSGALESPDGAVDGAGRPEVYSYEEAMTAGLYQKRLLNNPWGVLFKRELLGAGLRFREGTRYEDLDAFYRFYEGARRIVWLPGKYYFYRQHGESFLSRWSIARLDVLDVTDRMVDFFAVRNPRVLPAALDRRLSAHYNMFVLLAQNGGAGSEAEERCWQVIREGRRRALFDPRVRIKNKVAALLSYSGKKMFRRIVQAITSPSRL